MIYPAFLQLINEETQLFAKDTPFLHLKLKK